MSEVNENNEVESSSTQSTGPGRHLREARESRKLSVEDVAKQLRMQVSVIEGLEADDYSAMPGSMFVQGYLRSYSRMLGLAEENILALAHSEGMDEPKLVSTIAQGKAEVTSRDLPFRITTVLVILIVLLGLGWWLSQREPTFTTLSSDDAIASGEQGLPIPMVVDENEVVAEGSNIEPPVEQAAAEALAPQPESKAEPSTEPVDITPPAEAAEKTAVSELSADQPQSSLDLEYQADSWSSIKDATGRRIVYNTINAGRKLTLNGVAPFDVFLGYAQGVTIYYNGELYDHSGHHKGNVARFQVGKAEDNRPISGTN